MAGVTSIIFGSKSERYFTEFTQEASSKGLSIDKVINLELASAVTLHNKGDTKSVKAAEKKLKKVAKVLKHLSLDVLTKLELSKAQKIPTFQKHISQVTGKLNEKDKGADSHKKAQAIERAFIARHVRPKEKEAPAAPADKEGSVEKEGEDETSEWFRKESFDAAEMPLILGALGGLKLEREKSDHTKDKDADGRLTPVAPYPHGAPAQAPGCSLQYSNPSTPRNSKEYMEMASKRGWIALGPPSRVVTPVHQKSSAATPIHHVKPLETAASQGEDELTQQLKDHHKRSKTLDGIFSANFWGTGLVTPKALPPKPRALSRGASFSGSRSNSRATSASKGASLEPSPASTPGAHGSAAGAGKLPFARGLSHVRGVSFGELLLATPPLSPSAGKKASDAFTKNPMSSECRVIIDLLSDQHSDEKFAKCLELLANLNPEEAVRVFASASFEQLFLFVGQVDEKFKGALFAEIAEVAAVSDPLDVQADLQRLKSRLGDKQSALYKELETKIGKRPTKKSDEKKDASAEVQLDADLVLELLDNADIEKAQFDKCVEWLNEDTTTASDAKSVFKCLRLEKLWRLIGLIEGHRSVLLEVMKASAKRLITEGDKSIIKQLEEAIASDKSTAKQKAFYQELATMLA